MKKNKQLPRGLRNNNPGNIKIANNNWVGKIPLNENTDGVFEQFTDMKYGARALTKLFWTYLRQNPAHTIFTAISRFAPPSENNTIAYVDTVAKALNVSPDTKLSAIYKDKVKQYLFILAVIKHENGIAFDNKDIADGVALGNQ